MSKKNPKKNYLKYLEPIVVPIAINKSKTIPTEENDHTDTKECEEKIVEEEVKPHTIEQVQKEYDFDDVSDITTSVSKCKQNNELTWQKLDHLYRTYNLAHREQKNLTITSKKSEIISLIDTNPVVIIQGPTGCGKTTQVPQFILDEAFNKKQHCNIIVTQPRRIAAISIAKRVCAERNWPLGTLVGYKIGMIKKTSKDTRITFCTAGVLLRSVINKRHLLDFTHIIVDEVHERSLEMDFLLIILKKLLWSNSLPVKIILMSATINSDKFARYFTSPNSSNAPPAPIVDINKKPSYKINKYYLDDIKSLSNIPEVDFTIPKISLQLNQFCARLLIAFDEIDAVEVIDGTPKTINENNRHVVLIFLPGIWEIEELFSLLRSPHYQAFKWDIIVLHSTVTHEEQERIFEPIDKDYRRIILSTNIAESSITVPNVKYVIDYCLTKVQVINRQSNFQSLEMIWTSKASCEQRAGRTGRTMDGRVYRLVTKKMFEESFYDDNAPEILRAPLSSLVLNAKLLNMGEPKVILSEAIDPPDIMNLKYTILLLKEVGALLNTSTFTNPLDADLTNLGTIMATLPLDIHVSKLIALGHAFGVLRGAIIIGASITTKCMFNNPFLKKNEAYNAKLRWSNGSWCDLITYYQTYQTWLSEKANRTIQNKQAEKNWAKRHFLQLKVLYEIKTLVEEIKSQLKYAGIYVPISKDNYISDFEEALILKTIIAAAFYPNYFNKKFTCDNVDERERLKAVGGLNLSRTVYMTGWNVHQNGTLYAQRIQDYFKDCVGNATRQIRISFDGSQRIFITFPHPAKTIKQNVDSAFVSENNEITSRIPLSVFKALRKRRDGNKLNIKLVTEAEAEQLCNMHNIANTKTTIYRNKNNPMKIRPILPSIKETSINIKITNVKSPCNFWAIIDDRRTLEKWKLIDDNCNNFHMSDYIESNIPIGSMVLVYYAIHNRNRQFYRGIIEHYFIYRSVQYTNVLLIDVGVNIDVAFAELRRFKPGNPASEIPSLAFECILVNIKPSVLKNNNNWCNMAFQLFNHLTSKSKLVGEIYSVVDSVVGLRLMSIKNSETKCVNDILLESNYASYKAEGIASKTNNNVRLNYETFTEEQIKYYEESQYDQNYLNATYPEPPDDSECSKSVTLRGPFSPLEIQLSHKINDNQTKKVIIDATSVNSILLDQSTEDNEQCLVVAKSISETAGEQLILHDTTLMPNIRGLTTLLCLLFSPKIELRCNDLGTRYTSAICGLGAHCYTKKSIFPEHDMDILFDVEIDNVDLLSINRLRHSMTTSLLSSQNTSINEEQYMIACQVKCRQLLMNIFERERKSQIIYSCPSYGKWNQIHESKLLRPGNLEIKINNIFPLHFAIDLISIDPIYETTAESLKDFRLAAVENRISDPELTCPVCKVVINGMMNLRIHLTSPQHDQKENEFYAEFNAVMLASQNKYDIN